MTLYAQNGYSVIETARFVGPLPRLRVWRIPDTDRHVSLRDGSAGFLLVHIALWWHERIEPVDQGILDDWGWAVRPVRGQTTGYSNHAAGTAVDLNATRHPRGVSLARTFKAWQWVRIRARLRLYRGALRWGGDYQRSPVDGMHVEIVKPLPVVERIARRLARRGRGARVCEANPGSRAVIYS